MTDAVVIGGGVIGCAIARSLAGRGVATLVLERDEPCGQASWAAAGMLSPFAEADRPGPFLDLLRESRRRFPALVAQLREETGREVGYRSEGTLLVALSAEDEQALEERYRWQAAGGLPVERLSAGQVRELEPAVSAAVRWGMRFPEDHQVDNRLLGPALCEAARRAGAEFRLGAEVAGVVGSRGRVEGVRLANGERIAASTVVLAGGSWSGQLSGLPSPLPVEPVHGQLLALDADPSPLRHVVDSPRAYLVPRAGGRLIVGATMERTGFRKAVTAGGILTLLSAATEIVPGLADAAVAELWSGLRPDTPDHRPILGADPRLAGLVYATGHFRNGILLTPITAEIVTDVVLGHPPGRDLRPFSIERFRTA